MDLSFSSWNVFTLQYESLFPWAHLICVWNIDLVDKGQGSNKCVCVCVCVWERKRACGPVCSIHSMTWFFLSRYFYDLGRFGTELSLLLEHSADSFCLWKKKNKTSLWDWKRPSVFSGALVHGICNRNDLCKPTNARKSVFVTNSFSSIVNQQF